MKRTTLLLPAALKARAERRARELGISLGEFVRRSISSALDTERSSSADPLLEDAAVFRGAAPSDLAARHDEHLYGDDE